jgi:hypothetical protein
MSSSEDQSETLGLLWGARAIGNYIQRHPRDTYHLLQRGYIDADKVGDSWVTSKARLARQFSGEGRASTVGNQSADARGASDQDPHANDRKDSLKSKPRRRSEAA